MRDKIYSEYQAFQNISFLYYENIVSFHKARKYPHWNYFHQTLDNLVFKF